jgi:hypothetical protein
LHDPLKISARFDDPNLVSRAGLIPVMSLAERAGLEALVRRHVTIAARTGVGGDLKIGCLVAGMAAGADSIDDMDVLWHGAMVRLFGVRAPSTLGSFLRSFTWGNVCQLEAAGRDLLAGLAVRAPLLPGAGTLAFLDIDSMQRRVYGHAKQPAGFGHTKIQGKTVLARGPERAGRHDLHAAVRPDGGRRPARPARWRPGRLQRRPAGPTRRSAAPWWRGTGAARRGAARAACRAGAPAGRRRCRW